MLPLFWIIALFIYFNYYNNINYIELCERIEFYGTEFSELCGIYNVNS